ncbi:MAG: YggS family pyridoxal phosphate-dependent enzyme [Ruminococcus bromii]|nr:YggS family pyridoxal phosphate-dependent enzyme [Ruminococcus bromii]
MTEKCCDPRLMSVEENYKVITERIAEAAVRSGRRPEDITFLAATKTVPAEVINHAIDCGLRFVGENRVQEFIEKYDKINWAAGVSGQIIGRLQTNKVKYIVDKVDCIQSVDSVKLAGEISRLSEKAGRRMRVLVEVNIGGEESKGGVAPEALEAFLEEISAFSGILVDGLMAIPPICAEKTELRNYFSRMQQSFIDIGAKKIDNVFMNCLSMGMSSDYEEAILCGSTMVRIGSSLFGQRIYP